MSKSRSDYLLGHATTHGQVAKYLEAENPDTPVSELAERFEYWQRTGEIPE